MVLASLEIGRQFTIQNVSPAFTFCTSSFQSEFSHVKPPASREAFSSPKKISYKLLKKLVVNKIIILPLLNQ
jgi:hypothetical protein